MDLTSELKERIRTVPDFPKPGILFKDITPIFEDPPLLARCIDAIDNHFSAGGYDLIGGIEARGFIFGAMLSQKTGKPFIPIRKAGKLPGKTFRESYQLEYGQAEIEIHQDAIPAGARILLLDDLLATGGTAAAAIKLIEQTGGKLAGIAFLIDLAFLGSLARLRETGVTDDQILSLVSYGAGQ